MNTGDRLLIIGGGLSAIVALVHLAAIFIGGPAYRYLGAGERMARMADRGALSPIVITLGLTAMFAVWAAYACSGARLLPPLPLLRPVLIGIGSIYTLRGLVLIPQIVLFATRGATAVAPRHLFFSAVSLTLGVAYLLGTKLGLR
ncbi:MAG: hypothetical protein ABI672_10440 [Vicinamibacteria bacterium]